jgi:hypothetical protein
MCVSILLTSPTKIADALSKYVEYPSVVVKVLLQCLTETSLKSKPLGAIEGFQCVWHERVARYSIMSSTSLTVRGRVGAMGSVRVVGSSRTLLLLLVEVSAVMVVEEDIVRGFSFQELGSEWENWWARSWRSDVRRYDRVWNQLGDVGLLEMKGAAQQHEQMSGEHYE